MVTIFTPTYNRAYIIGKLYQSLCQQTNKDFEWLIIDDGSTDDTEKLISKWQQEKIIPIFYYKQSNGGKHRAINRGVKEAHGRLFFIVDSDDYLTDDAIEQLISQYNTIKDNQEFAGVSGFRAFPNGKRIGRGNFNSDILDCTHLERAYKYKLRGDFAEAYKTEILAGFPFPNYPNEKFCAESLVWNRIGCKYKIRYFNKDIYVCDYLPDGLTRASVRNRRNSPTYATLIYKELMEMEVPIKIKIKSAINFWRFYPMLKTKILKTHIPSFAWLLSPIGFLVFFIDSYKLRK